MGWKFGEKSIAYRSRRIWWQFHRLATTSYWSLGITWVSRNKMLSIHLFRWDMNFIFPQSQKVEE